MSSEQVDSMFRKVWCDDWVDHLPHRVGISLFRGERRYPGDCRRDELWYWCFECSLELVDVELPKNWVTIGDDLQSVAKLKPQNIPAGTLHQHP